MNLSQYIRSSLYVYFKYELPPVYLAPNSYSATATTTSYSKNRLGHRVATIWYCREGEKWLWHVVVPNK